MEQSIRILETEVRNQKTNLQALEFDKSNALNEALFKQKTINDNAEKLIVLEKELNVLYAKFPGVEPLKLSVNEKSSKIPAASYAKKPSRAFDEEEY